MIITIILWASVVIIGGIAINYYLRCLRFKKDLLQCKNALSTKTVSYLSDEKLKVIEAFSLNGKKYFMYEDTLHTPAGRSLYALTVYEEFNMRCDKDYLKAHQRATELILNSNPIKLTVLSQINQNLKERLEMAAMPDHIYKLAAVLFFDETESPYSVSPEYNRKKIEEWKKSGVAYDFFLNTPLKDLMPALKSLGGSAETYFQTAEMIDEIHRTNIRELLSKTA